MDGSIGDDVMVKLNAAKDEIRDEYTKHHGKPWIVGFSAGKDSTFLLQLVFEVLLEMRSGSRTRPVYVVGNDTQVESPVMVGHLRTTLDKIGRAADTFRLPLTVHTTTPKPSDTFWVNLIGRGYRAPTRMFRWCTDRLKIEPTSRFVTEHVRASGGVILLLGVRSAESSNRAQSIAKHTVAGERLNPHDDLKGCLVFRPIKDFTTEEVWQTLLQRPAPWGGSHRNLITLYRNAQAGECPLVIDKSQAPSCGTSGVRFGCWTCTVVDKDKSGEALADAGIEHYEELVGFRDWLAEFCDDRENRQAERRNGQFKIMDNGALMPGPLTLDARHEVLRRLLKMQSEIGKTLITTDEVEACRRQWADDVMAAVGRNVQLPLVANGETP